MNPKLKQDLDALIKAKGGEAVNIWTLAERIAELERQLVDANGHVAALTAALETRRSACNEESERADELEQQLAEIRDAYAQLMQRRREQEDRLMDAQRALRQLAIALSGSMA